MVGQKNLKATITELVENNSFPRFCILVGPEGSGKKQLCKYIARKLKLITNTYGVGVDDVRKMIAEAHKVTTPILYVLPDADKMSQAAKNALLKVTEEPPQSAYFVITLTDLNNTLGTIRSRGTILYTDPYTSQDIHDYYVSTTDVPNNKEMPIIEELCETPGEVDKLVNMKPSSFYEYVEKVVNCITEVSGANSFKIAQKIKFKDTAADADKYDLKLFWKAFMTICSSRLRDDPMRYAAGVRVTSHYLQELRITGINKASMFDIWILDIRKEMSAWNKLH